MGGGLKKGLALNYSEEAMDVWGRTALNTTRLAADRLPVSDAYAQANHTQLEYVGLHVSVRVAHHRPRGCAAFDGARFATPTEGPHVEASSGCGEANKMG